MTLNIERPSFCVPTLFLICTLYEYMRNETVWSTSLLQWLICLIFYFMKHYALRFLKQIKYYASYKLIGNYTAYTLIIWLIIFVILCKRCSRYFKIWKRLHIFVQSSFHLKEINVNWLGAIKQLVSYIGRFLSFCSDFKKK